MDPETMLGEAAEDLLSRHYLMRDEQGRVIEKPSEMFGRVGRNLTAVDILFSPDIYDQSGRQACRDGSEPIGTQSCVPPYSAFDVATLFHSYVSLCHGGYMKASFSEVLECLQDNLPEVASAQAKLVEMMHRCELVFGPALLMNAGRRLQCLADYCAVPVEDSLRGIFEAIKSAALIRRTVGEASFCFSSLRPREDIVKTTGGVASGPLSFMRVFDAAVTAVRPHGGGASIGVLRCDHPDVIEFIANGSADSIRSFSIAIVLTDELVSAAMSGGSCPLRNPRNGQHTSSLRARDLLTLIAETAWQTGNPTVIFSDNVNRNASPYQTHTDGKSHLCLENGLQPLQPFEPCCVASLNLAAMLSESSIDYHRLREVIDAGMHYLDNAVEASRYPIAETAISARRTRKVGLGIMGWSDVLDHLRIPYGSDEALSLSSELMSFVSQEAAAASARLAETRGAFPDYTGSSAEAYGWAPRRNSATTAIAPMVDLGVIAGATPGIEPQRAALGRAVLPSPEWEIKTQAAFQRYTDGAVLTTILMPAEASKQDYVEMYLRAHALGCKVVRLRHADAEP